MYGFIGVFCVDCRCEKIILRKLVTFCLSESGFTRLWDYHDCRVIFINFSIDYI